MGAMAKDRLSTRQFSALFDPNQGGFSVNLQTGEAPKGGYMVSEAGTERSIPSAMIQPSDLDRYASDHLEQLSYGNRYFGGWNDTSRSAIDLDVSRRYPSGGPVEHAAAQVAMIRHGQRAMYNVDTGDVEENVHYGKSIEKAHSDIKRDYEAAARAHR